MAGDLDWRVAGGIDLGGNSNYDPLLREPDDDALDEKRAMGPWWKRAAAAAAALERARSRRPEPMLTHGVEFCAAQPVPGLSPCLRLEDHLGHGGPHVVAGLVRGGANLYAVGDGEPVLVLEYRPQYVQPTRAELAEVWAWHEETTAQGRDAVGRRRYPG